MTKRSIRRFDKSATRVFKAMRTSIVELGFETIDVDKGTGLLKFTTKKKYLFFGGLHYTLVLNNLTDRDSEVSISAEGDVNQGDFKKMATLVFNAMDKELPIASYI